MGIDNKVGNLTDIGCGYGIFLVPISKLVSKNVIGIDIDDKMIKVCTDKIKENNIEDVELIHGDIGIDKTIKTLEEYKGEIDYVTLFNILHCENPTNLIKNVYDIISENGRIGVIHWKYEKTPRGPSMEIRPKPEVIINWATKIGLF